MRRKGLVAGIVLAQMLSACTTYSDTLEQKLDGKSLEEKRVILAHECREQIRQGARSQRPGNLPHLERMREICAEMTGQPISMDGLDAPE